MIAVARGLAGLILILASLVACGPASELAVGIVVAVDAQSPADARGFTLRTSEGERLEFRLGALEDPGAFPLGHLSQHMATGQPVAVAYRVEDGVPVAYRFADAPWANP